MSKHTPGPWYTGLPNNRDNSAIGIRGEQWVIADMCDDGYDADTQEANARLIAAAPELLEALILVRDYVVTMKQMGHQYQVAIDAAIAKATGETP